jgi:hypothetical protein
MDKDFYIQYAIDKEQNIQKFLKNKKVQDLNTGFLYDLEYSLIDDFRKNYFFYKNKIEYLNYICSDYASFFITITLDQKKYVDVKSAYKDLNLFWRNFYNILKKHNKDFYYVLVVEPHKKPPYFPHFHIQIFYKDCRFQVRSKTADGKYRYFSVSFSTFLRDHIYKYRKEFNERYSAGIGRMQIKSIEKEKGYVSKYILKYLAKSLNTDDVNEIYFLRGWITYNKIRNFRMSVMELPRYIFSRLLPFLPKEVKEKKSYNPYQYFSENTDILKVVKNANGKIIHKVNITKENSDFLVYVEIRNKVKFRNFTLLDKKDFYNFYYDPGSLRKNEYYKILDFIQVTGYDPGEFDYNYFYSLYLDYIVEKYSYNFVYNIIIYSYRSDGSLCKLYEKKRFELINDFI